MFHRHAPEVAAVDAGHAVVTRQPLVDEGVVGGQQVEHVAVCAEDALDEQLGLAPHRLPQPLADVRKAVLVRHDRRHVAQVEPLAREARDERPRTLVGEHTARLLLQHRRVAQPAGRGELEQLVVGDAAPQEEGQPGRQLPGR